LIVFGIVVGLVIAVVVTIASSESPRTASGSPPTSSAGGCSGPWFALAGDWPQLAFLGRRLTPGGLGLGSPRCSPAYPSGCSS
jgi:hypothetical protein